MKIILASGSLGRRKLLESLGLKFEVMESNVDEEKIVDRDPVKMAVKRATAKAEEVAERVRGNKGDTGDKGDKGKIIIIGADTVGFQGSWVFNKPKSREEAEEMLNRLSGKTHKYVSAHYLITTKKVIGSELLSKIVGYDVSSVTFRKLTKADIDFYLDHVEYLKLCGAFKIMASPQNFVTKTEGSISNIIGLSLEKLIPVLNRFI